jgi:hypothetical protein
MRAAAATNEAAKNQHARELRKADQEHERETTKSNRELIFQAIEWTRSDNELTQAQGWAMIDGLSRMRLAEPDAILIMSVTRPEIERRLSDARRVLEIEGQQVGFALDLGPREEEEGSDEAAPSDR